MRVLMRGNAKDGTAIEAPPWRALSEEAEARRRPGAMKEDASAVLHDLVHGWRAGRGK